jgi:hypothetical protein
VLLRLRYCVFSEASTSMTSWIFSPTTTPPAIKVSGGHLILVICFAV